MATDKETLRIMIDVVKATFALQSVDDRLFVLELAWLALASAARTDALALPEGFRTERARQAARLEQMAALVRAGEPHVELERLWDEGDHAGFVRQIRDLMDRERATGNDEKGGA